MGKRKLRATFFLTILQGMRPILIPIFWIMDKTYKLLFGRSDLRSSHSREDRLTGEIKSTLSFLFEDYGARIISDETIEHPRPFDYAVAIVALEDLFFRFIRGRGEFRVQVATECKRGAWEDLPVVLHILDDGFQQREFTSSEDVAVALKPRMKLLREAFASDKESMLRSRLADVHSFERAVIRQWENEINRRVYDK